MNDVIKIAQVSRLECRAQPRKSERERERGKTLMGSFIPRPVPHDIGMDEVEEHRPLVFPRIYILSHTHTLTLSLSYTHMRAHVYDIKCLIVHTRTHAHTHAHNTKRRAPYIDMDHARVRNPGPEPHRRVGRQQLLVQHVHKLAKPVKPFRKRVPRLNCVKLAFIISRVVEIARTSAYKFHKRRV